MGTRDPSPRAAGRRLTGTSRSGGRACAVRQSSTDVSHVNCADGLAAAGAGSFLLAGGGGDALLARAEWLGTVVSLMRYPIHPLLDLAEQSVAVAEFQDLVV